MTGNRLTAAASANAFSSIEEMREWCWDRNVMARDAGSQRWLYVSRDKDTGLHSIKARNGADAADVIAVSLSGAGIPTSRAGSLTGLKANFASCATWPGWA